MQENQLSSNEARLQLIVSAMPAPLQEVYQTLRDKFEADSCQEVMARYDIGTTLKNLRADTESYGEAPMSQLATAFGVAENMLWSYAKMATVWDRDEISAILSLRNSKNLPLSYSHITLLAGVDDASLRETIQQTCLAESLTVRDLATTIQTTLGERRSSGTRRPLPPRSPIAGLGQLTKMAASLTNRQDTYEESVFSQLDDIPRDELSDRLLECVESAEAAVLELTRFAQSTVLRLTAAAEIIRRRLNSSDEEEEEETEDEEEELETELVESIDAKGLEYEIC